MALSSGDLFLYNLSERGFCPNSGGKITKKCSKNAHFHYFLNTLLPRKLIKFENYKYLENTVSALSADLRVVGKGVNHQSNILPCPNN